MFQLDARLDQDTFLIGDFSLCRLLLMNDASYPWFILVPRRAGIRELYQLDQPDQEQLLKESAILSRVLQRIFQADKLNIAALGNLVPQLHVHHIARHQTDQAWPKPVWGLFPARPYTAKARREVVALVIRHLEDFTPAENTSQAPGIL